MMFLIPKICLTALQTILIIYNVLTLFLWYTGVSKMWLFLDTPFVFTSVSHGTCYATSKHSESTVSSCHLLYKRCTLQQLDAVTVETRIYCIFYY